MESSKIFENIYFPNLELGKQFFFFSQIFNSKLVI